MSCGAAYAILVLVGTMVRDILMGSLGQLRYEPVDKRIRGVIGGQVVIDTDRALLVWEPKRVVPSYAVPVEELEGLTGSPQEPETDEPAPPEVAVPHIGDRPVYDPSVPFAVHTAAGAVLDLRVAGTERPAAAFQPADDALSGYVIVDFDACDEWFEEDERNVGHPRDPFHRIEIVHSSRSVRVERDGELLAASTRPYLLLEAPLPVRYYLPPEDVSDGLLQAELRSDAVRLQGAGHLLVAGERGRHRMELSRPSARGRRGDRPHRLLQRTG